MPCKENVPADKRRNRTDPPRSSPANASCSARTIADRSGQVSAPTSCRKPGEKAIEFPRQPDAGILVRASLCQTSRVCHSIAAIHRRRSRRRSCAPTIESVPFERFCGRSAWKEGEMDPLLLAPRPTQGKGIRNPRKPTCFRRASPLFFFLQVPSVSTGQAAFRFSFSSARRRPANSHRLCANTAHATASSRCSNPLLLKGRPRKSFFMIPIRPSV